MAGQGKAPCSLCCVAPLLPQLFKISIYYPDAMLSALFFTLIFKTVSWDFISSFSLRDSVQHWQMGLKEKVSLLMNKLSHCCFQWEILVVAFRHLTGLDVFVY